MAQQRQLGYNIYDILPNTEQLSDIIDGDTTGTGDVALEDVGIAADVPASLIESGKVDVGATGITVAADTSADAYVPDLDKYEVTHNLAFSVTDKDTVAWGAGTIYVGDGTTTYSINAGNTGNMAARTYIFLDISVSTTVLQTTTTVSGTVGPNRKLIAVAQNGSAQPQFQVYGGIGGLKLPAAGTSIANNNWQYSGTWSVTDADTVAWGAGTLTTSDGGSYSITGSNTGNMATKTYIYFDLAVSSTAFQTTTTAANCVGDGKILIAVAQNATNEARYVVMNDFQLNIDAAQIVAGSITANEIAAGAVTAAKISVSNLSAIVADMGTITAGTITLDTSGYIRGGQTAYDTGTGFFLGYSGGAYKFSIGTGGSTSNSLTWDGTNLTVNGYTQTGIGTFGGDGSDGALSISSGTTTLDAAGARVLVKNYTSISITGTAKLTISNKHANGTILILKSKGNVTITSSVTSIDLAGMGGDGGAVPSGIGAASNPGSVGTSLLVSEETTAIGSGTTGGAQLTDRYSLEDYILNSKAISICCGSGGASGQNGSANFWSNGGAGGNGGGALILECGGALTFSGTISVSGSNGSSGTNLSGGGNQAAGGGGGGGAAGMAIVLYRTLTSNTGVKTAVGGNAGNGGNCSTNSAGSGGVTGGAGGAGAGSKSGAGGNAGALRSSDGDGNAGSNGGNGAGGGGGGGSTETTYPFTVNQTGGAGGTTGSDIGSTVIAILQNKYFA